LASPTQDSIQFVACHVPHWDAARPGDLGSQASRKFVEDRTRNAPLPGRNCVVIRIVRILEPKPSNFSGLCISRDDVQMDVPVLVPEEGIVEMVRLEGSSQTRSHEAHLLVQCVPLVGA